MNPYEEFRTETEELLKACHRLSELMYVTGHGGNAAIRLRDDLVLITPTQMNKGCLALEDLVFIDMRGKKVAGARQPTGETPMYLNFFRERSDVRSVLHCHPPYTNAFAISRADNILIRPLFPETITEVGPVPLVSYGEPLTQRLADNFLPLISKFNAFLMQNHGLVIMSPWNMEWLMMTTELLEMTSVSILHALTLGGIRELPGDDLLRLDNIMKKRGLPMFGAPGAHGSLVDVYRCARSFQDGLLLDTGSAIVRSAHELAGLRK